MSSSTITPLQTITQTTPPSWTRPFLDQQTLQIMQTIVSSLSIFGSLCIIITYFIFKDLQQTTRQFLVYISVGDFFTVYPYLMVVWVDRSSGSVNCIAQSFVTTTAVMWSFFWTSSLAIYLYIVIVKENQERADKFMPYFHVINWGLPLVLVGAACGNDMLDNEKAVDSGGWCWIKLLPNRDETVWWMLACGKFWEILSYFVDVIFCFIVTRKINSEVEELQGSMSVESTQVAIQGRRKLIWAPCLFVFLRIWGTIRFLLFCFQVNEYNHIVINKILIVCHIIGDSSQGFVYFVLFCVCTEKFRRNVAEALCSCCKRKGTNIVSQGKPNGSQCGSAEEHRYLLQNPKHIVFYT